MLAERTMHYIQPSPDMRRETLTQLAHIPWPSDDVSMSTTLLQRCPRAGETPLASVPHLAASLGVASLHVKDERTRMGLGSFKALGAAYVIAHDAQAGRAKGQTYVTASAGNHGLSVAAGAAAFGANAIVFLAETVPESFAERLRNIGAEVRREGAMYEDAMKAAAALAESERATLLSDSSWDGYVVHPHRLMEGYLVLMQEAAAQIPTPPTHLFLQAGVGGLAAASAAYARKVWGHEPTIIVVEPDAAPALIASIAAGSPQVTQGPASQMGRLDCKEPSLIALKGLARDADIFMTVTEDEGTAGHETFALAGLPSTPSGAAGLAGLQVAMKEPDIFRLSAESRVLLILSEGPTQ